MTPEDMLLIVMLGALTLYAVLGGADFGAGVWEFSTVLQSTERERKHVYRALGPVWEANHVWLIFIVVIMMNGFPIAFGHLSRALWCPLLLALCGIVFRGAAFIFRSYGHGARPERTTWEATFAIASTATPLFLGAAVGAIASGQLGDPARHPVPDAYLTGWVSALSIYSGFFAVGMCAYLAAVFLAREAVLIDDAHLTHLWRQRSLSIGVLMGLCSAGGLVMVWLEAPHLYRGFLVRGWPLVIISFTCGVGSLVMTATRHCHAAMALAIATVTAVIWGWGISQYPLLIPPSLDAAHARAPRHVLVAMLIVIGIGAVFLLPSLAYLLRLFKRDQRQQS